MYSYIYISLYFKPYAIFTDLIKTIILLGDFRKAFYQQIVNFLKL